MEGKKALEREPFCVGTGRAVNDGRTKMGPAACFFLVRQGDADKKLDQLTEVSGGQFMYSHEERLKAVKLH
ncbi:hypothetical protein, partial [Dialister hominis]|uniref:hypothetical protein n=1 Tax=Dialister hominis TaxID=2582419 RepID=UPI003FEDDEDD